MVVLVKDLWKSTDSGGVFLLVLFDLSVAFNVTDHDILLNSYGDVGTELYFLS